MDELKNQQGTPLAEAKKPKVVIEVNNHPVTLEKSRVTGLDIKQAAVNQSVPHVSVDFLLMQVVKKGAVEAIADDKTVTINKNSKFKMVAADDNS